MNSSVKFDFSKLNTFVKMTDDKHQVRVGIFGSKNARGVAAPPTGKGGTRKTYKVEAGKTNAEVGFLQEYGSVADHIPPRSFLRMPLALRGAQIVKEASVGAQALLAAGKTVMVLKRLGIACENAIQRAFASRGYGTWKENASLTVKLKGSDAPLIDTAQLRRSISSKVVSL